MKSERKRRSWRRTVGSHPDRRPSIGVSWLDAKLGIRMLAKYPGLSIVAVVGMALAILIGAGYFAFIGAMLDSTVPVDEGQRLVVIRTRHIAGPEAGDVTRASAHDFVHWRGAIKSVTDLGAFRDESYNLITANGTPQLVRAAAMTASGFRLTRVAPLLGRTLLDEDERPGAPPVLVIGYETWQRQFNGDPRVLGTTVRLDETVHAIVGVMPEGFGFPIRHGYWVPLRVADAAADPGADPSLHVFGRLADGFSEADARAELAVVSEQMAAAFPKTHTNTRSQLLSYTHAFIGVEGPEIELAIRSLQIGVGLLLVIVAVNVAIVVYARTATRMGEIAIRTALGATRGRVVTQLFVEALVLSVTAAAIGLTLLSSFFAWFGEYTKNSPDRDRLPFWIQFGLSPGLILYVVLLAVVAGIIIGVLPALKATGKRVQAGLQHFASRGASMQLGRTWTTLIVLQVAIAVAVLPAAMHQAAESLRLGLRGAAPAASELLRGTVAVSRDDAYGDGGSAAEARAGDPRFTNRMTTLLERLEAAPEVSGVTFAQEFPGQERYASIEVETAGGRPAGAAADDQSMLIGTGTNRIAPNLFELFGVRILAGRGFRAADALPGATAVVVDQTFAERLAGGGNVVGRRIRYSRRKPNGEREPGPWHEIVGIVPPFAETFTAPNSFEPPTPRLYHAAVPGQVYPAAVVIRVRGDDPARFAQKFREITSTVDPTLKLERIASVLQTWNFDRRFFSLMAIGIIAVTLSVLLLSAAGIYAMMSFTVSRRRREIGIRSALGADTRRIVSGIFGRAGAQLGAGIAAGLAMAVAFEWLGPGGTMGGHALVILPSVVAVMFTVGLLAAVGPARRGLAVQPTEALREE